MFEREIAISCSGGDGDVGRWKWHFTQQKLKQCKYPVQWQCSLPGFLTMAIYGQKDEF